MTGKLRVAMAGTGYFSQFHRDAWARCPEVEITGIADLDLERAQKVAQEFGCPAFDSVANMLDESGPDLIDIITPPTTHLPLIELAANRGVNVVCQKPFCGDLETASKAVELANAAGIYITVHENFRFQPWYAAIKRELDAGRIGHIYQTTFRLRPGDGQGPQAYLDRQPYFQKMPRFLVHETAIHLIDVMRYLHGEATSVWADLQRLNPAIAGEDKCLVVLEFGGGVRGLLDGNRLADHAAQNRRRTMGEMMIEGEKGTLFLDGDASLTFRAHGENPLQAIPFDWNDHGFGGDCVYRFTRHVVDHYVRGSTRMNDAKSYLDNLAIEEAIYRSAASGQRLAL